MTCRCGRRVLLGGLAALTVRCTKHDPPSPSERSPSTPPSSTPPWSTRQGLAEGGSFGEEVRLAASVERVSSAPPAPSEAIETRELAFASSPVGPEKAVAIVPQWGAAGERFPVLIALHGRGEAVRGLDVGAYSWLRDYELGKTIARLRAPPLTKGDSQGVRR